MDSRRLVINAVTSAVQVVVNGLTLLIIYRFVRDQVGAADFGVWAVVAATTATGGVANMGITPSAVKYVSQYLARGDRQRVAEIIQTSLVSVAVVIAVPAVLLLLFGALILRAVLHGPAEIGLATGLLPLSVAAFWIMQLAAALQSSLDGLHRIYVRSLLFIGVAPIYLVACLVLVPRIGLYGLLYAQIIQATLLLITALVALKHFVPELPFLPIRWSRSVFKEIVNYSLNFQVLSFGMMLFEPTTKWLMAAFGGVQRVADFEFAYRMVTQLRALITMAHQSVVPAFAHINETEPEAIPRLYRESFSVLSYVLLPSLFLFIGATPLISRLWIGELHPDFVRYADLLFIGWFLNMYNNPAFFAYLGTGNMKWNVISHLLMGSLNLALGLAGSMLFGDTGVVVGFVLALLIGSAVPLVAFHREYGIRLNTVFSRYDLYFVLAGLLGLMLVRVAGVPAFTGSMVSYMGLTLLTFGALFAVPLWLHPVRYRLMAVASGFLVRPDTREV